MLLLRAVGEAAPDRSRAALDVLVRAERESPESVREMLRSPWVGSWSSRIGRRLIGAAPDATDAGTTMEEDFDHLDRLADQVSGRSGTIARELRAVQGEHTFRVTLEDRDPYRDCFTMAVTGPVPDGTAARWQDRFTEASRLLAVHLPDRAAELRAGLRSMVPLAGIAGAPGLSATSHHAFGGLALTEPVDAAAFAVTLIHEFQHSTLSALLDLARLFDPAAREKRFFAPWRRDSRPLGGLLQGVYAFLAVAEAWNALRAEPALATRAEAQFAETTAQLAAALPQLRSAPALTAEGRRFTEGLTARLDLLTAVPVRPETAGRARRDVEALRADWQTRHGLTPTAVRSPD
ncbi:HEXXH motif domain-containing protein [Actinoplanes rectilineatus]|uniref:HEXXH motif domain-containing protein n=1 Tax=Actinoplanes rectilineatus TaxID=113571 RepID=UPI0006968057|nr:HEXXH motif domain-containing protein [Actinoplanes rectilineatus]